MTDREMILSTIAEAIAPTWSVAGPRSRRSAPRSTTGCCASWRPARATSCSSSRRGRRHRLRRRGAGRRARPADLERLLAGDGRGRAQARRRARACATSSTARSTPRGSSSTMPPSTVSSAASATCSSRIPPPRSRRRCGCCAPAAAGAGGVGRSRAQPVDRDRGAQPRRARPCPAAGAERRPFRLASAAHTSELLRGAGFGDVRTEDVPLRLRVPDADEYLAFIADTAGPTALALRALPEAELAPVRADVVRSLAPFITSDGYELPGVALCAAARWCDTGVTLRRAYSPPSPRHHRNPACPSGARRAARGARRRARRAGRTRDPRSPRETRARPRRARRYRRAPPPARRSRPSSRDPADRAAADEVRRAGWARA